MAFTQVFDSLLGTEAADILLGDLGDPFGTPVRFIGAQAGNDQLRLQWQLQNTQVQLGAGDDSFVASFADSSLMRGGADNDRIELSLARRSLINGNRGDDALRVSNLVNSQLYGGAGNDLLTVGLVSDGEVRGGGGNDTIVISGSVAGTSTINANAGNDRLDGSATRGGVLLQGGAGDDLLLAGSGDDKLLAGSENDLIRFRPDTFNAADLVDGGEGIDTLVIEAGSEAITPDNLPNVVNVEVIVVEGAPLDLVIPADSTIPEVIGTPGNDTIDAGALLGRGITLDGAAGDDILRGSEQADLLLGSAGNDLLLGRGGNDSISGSIGLDTLEGALGLDLLTGGADADTFVQRGAGTSAASSGFSNLLDVLDPLDPTVVIGQELQEGSVIGLANGVDLITDFSAEDVIDADVAGGSLTLVGLDPTTLLTAGTYTARGSYSGGSFSLSSTGADMVLVQSAGASLEGCATWLVLQGYGALNTNGADTNLLAVNQLV